MTVEYSPSGQSSYKGKRGLKTLDICIDKAIKPALKERGFAESRLLTDWPLIVGDVLAAQTSVQRLRFPKNSQSEGTLYVEVYHSGLATELVYMAPVILEKIAAYFGYKAIASIKWVQRPGYRKPKLPEAKVPAVASEGGKKKVQQMVASLEDDVVKTALEQLGSHVLGAEGK